VQVAQNRVTGQMIAASEMARIQDGTVETFAAFLDGIWFKTTSETDVRYISFDYQKREITFLFADEQEIYAWEGSTLRRNGIYLSTVNTSIANLSRMVDVSLSSVDEIKVRVQDDVRMLIGESTYWDGSYFKVSQKTGGALVQETARVFPDDLMAALTAQESWRLDTGETVRFSKSGYALSSPGHSEEGRFSLLFAGDSPVIEFRSKSKEPFFGKTYRVLRDDAALTLEPVQLNASGVAAMIKPSLRLSPH
jgi:hypothetical protein